MSGYFESLDSNLKLESAPIGVSFSTLSYTHEGFLENLKNNVFSPTKIKSIIENNVDLYFSYQGFSDPKTRTNMQLIWTNSDFLANTLALLNENQKFRQKVVYMYQRDVNIIASDYISAANQSLKDSEIAAKLYEIACVVNAEYIVQLSSNIPISCAKNLCIAYFSTINPTNGIRSMVNEIFAFAGNDIIFSIEQIVYIFYVFFKDKFSDLFGALMTFRFVLSNDASEESKQMKQADDNISSALINILNSMDSGQIREVLAKYSNLITFMNISEKAEVVVRFSLKHLPAAFKNVAEAVIAAEQNGYYIP